MSATVINILTATLLGKYRIRLCFDDGTVQDVDFGSFLGHSPHPEIRAYLDEARFNTFRIEYGELVWGDYALCFPMIDLYRNQIHKQASIEAAA